MQLCQYFDGRETVMSTLTKKDLAMALAKKIKINSLQAKEIVELFFEEIRKSLESGENVHLSGFGNFSLRDKTARPGRNPKTGDFHAVNSRRVVTFKPGIKLKEKLKASLSS